MKHFTLPRFWQHYNQLPAHIQHLADKNYALLRADPLHPSLHFKKVGQHKQLWSARVGEHYRALGLDKTEGVIWFWIGTHAAYDTLLAATLQHHGVLHLLFHPAHIGKAEVSQALLEAVAAARQNGMEWWTARQLNDWERARRKARWDKIERSEAGCKLLLHSGESLPDATLLFLGQAASGLAINDKDYSPTTVTRWGFEFQAVTLDLAKSTAYHIELSINQGI